MLKRIGRRHSEDGQRKEQKEDWSQQEQESLDQHEA